MDRKDYEVATILKFRAVIGAIYKAWRDGVASEGPEAPGLLGAQISAGGSKASWRGLVRRGVRRSRFAAWPQLSGPPHPQASLLMDPPRLDGGNITAGCVNCSINIHTNGPHALYWSKPAGTLPTQSLEMRVNIARSHLEFGRGGSRMVEATPNLAEARPDLVEAAQNRLCLGRNTHAMVATMPSSKPSEQVGTSPIGTPITSEQITVYKEQHCKARFLAHCDLRDSSRPSRRCSISGSFASNHGHRLEKDAPAVRHAALSTSTCHAPRARGTARGPLATPKRGGLRWPIAAMFGPRSRASGRRLRSE